MPPSRMLVLGVAAALAACAPPSPPFPAATPAAAAGARAPQTRAERSAYTETSRHADVVAFLDSLQRLGAPVQLGTLGSSAEGRAIPYAVLSRPLVRSAEEARRSGRPIVYVQGGIHAGELEGKEALLALLRDLAVAPRPNALDSLVLVAVPMYNVDGGERLGPQARQRPEQNGPELVGQRSNAQGLDLNRDYVKAAAPETRAALAFFSAWQPDVFVDLHATDGSYHGYALTYAPSLNPAAGAAGALARDAWLPELRRRMRARHGFETFDYGNFSLQYGADVNTDTVKDGWYSYDHRPRFGSNYYGLRGGVSILGEAFSHDPLERRVRSTYAFVREIVALAAERRAELRALRQAPPSPPGTPLPLRSELTRTPFLADLLAEDLAEDPDSVPDEPGVPPGLRRTGRYRTLRLPVHDRFAPTLTRALPTAYVLPPAESAAVVLLRLHGVRVDTLAEPRRVRAEAFTVREAVRAPRAFQGHHELRLEGEWRVGEETIPAGSFWVTTAQPLGVLAAYLLEPESDDGLATWSSPVTGAPVAHGRLARVPAAGERFPVLRMPGRATPAPWTFCTVTDTAGITPSLRLQSGSKPLYAVQTPTSP